MIFCCAYRALLMVSLLTCLFVGEGALASLNLSSPRSNALANSDSHGYVRLVQELGNVNSGKGRFPLLLVFTSNPNQEPGLFGPGWRFPLFDSSVVKYNNYNLVWEAPDERRYFFPRDNDADARNGEVFRHQGGDWSAVIGRNGDIVIQSLKDPASSFIYQRGRLQRFHLGGESEMLRVEYNGRGQPLRLVTDRGRTTLLEFEYKGSVPVGLRMGDQQFAFEAGGGEMMSPDGKSQYGHYRLPFLRSISTGETEATKFSYSMGGSKQRPVLVSTRNGSTARGTASVPINRLTVTAQSGNESFVEWEAQSGFIASDSGGKYSVDNPQYDPHLKDPNVKVPSRVRISPTKVAIRRIPEGGKEQVWSYDWESGVKIRTASSGALVRRTLILSKGPAYLKLRKREVLRDGKWVVAEQRFYDPEGRLVRLIEGDSVTVWRRAMVGDLEVVDEIVNGQTIETLKRRGEQNIEKVIYREDGIVHTVTYDENNRWSKVDSSSGTSWSYEYDELGRRSAMYIDDRLHATMSYFDNGQEQERVIYGEDGASPVRKFVNVFDADSGRYVSQIIDLNNK